MAVDTESEPDPQYVELVSLRCQLTEAVMRYIDAEELLRVLRPHLPMMVYFGAVENVKEGRRRWHEESRIQRKYIP
jgi:hypothetical protein